MDESDPPEEESVSEQTSVKQTGFEKSVSEFRNRFKIDGRKKLESPVPRITKITQYGRVEITFSSGIHIAPNMTMIRNGTIEIDGADWPVLLLEIDPGWDSDPEKHKFDWVTVNQTSTKLILQLYFEDAKYISSNFDREWLKVTFMDPLMFFGVNGMVIDEEDRTITREIPPQLGETE